ncbi:MAG: M13 family metallopeptidase [Caulobacteraceae bacterium]
MRPPSANTAAFGPWGLDLNAQDHTIKPGDDLYLYENGRYLSSLVIPPAQSNWNPYAENAQRVQAQERTLIEEAIASRAPVTTEQGKLAAMYMAFMDEPRINALGAAPLAPDLASIRAASTPKALSALMGGGPAGFNGSIIELDLRADAHDPTRYAIRIQPGGLYLPTPGFSERDYYLKPEFAQTRAAFLAYAEKLLSLANWPGDSAAQAQAALAFETEIAKVTPPADETNNSDDTYTSLSEPQLQAMAPGIDWPAFFRGAGLGAPDRIVGYQPQVIAAIAKAYAQTPIATLQAWQAVRTIDAAARYLSVPFVEARFEFYGRTLSGVSTMSPRQERALDLVDATLGQAMGKLYVARYFPAASKTKIEGYAINLRAAFRRRIETVDWMSPDTRAEALKKLDKLVFKVGYPEHFRDYSALAIREDDLLGDVKRARAFDWQRQLDRRALPVSHTEWEMLPQEVGAQYLPDANAVEFPAAFMLPPFFDPNADDAVNYGAIGGQIGHEMTHAFDNNGRKRDADGRLRDWWSSADAAQFDARAAKLVAQYDSYEVLPGAHINGKFTLGENIADQGGLSLALDAYHASLGGKPAAVLDGLTGDQRVFLAWAQMFRGLKRPTDQRRHLIIDDHSPEKYRVDGVVRNLDAWYAAFDVGPQDKLYLAPADRAHIW